MVCFVRKSMQSVHPSVAALIPLCMPILFCSHVTESYWGQRPHLICPVPRTKPAPNNINIFHLCFRFLSTLLCWDGPHSWAPLTSAAGYIFPEGNSGRGSEEKGKYSPDVYSLAPSLQECGSATPTEYPNLLRLFHTCSPPRSPCVWYLLYSPLLGYRERNTVLTLGPVLALRFPSTLGMPFANRPFINYSLN